MSLKVAAKPSLLRRGGHAAKQVAKSILRVGTVPAGVKAARDLECDTCEFAGRAIGIVRTCTICSCCQRVKSDLANERCPMGDPRYPRTKNRTPRWIQYVAITIDQ